MAISFEAKRIAESFYTEWALPTRTQRTAKRMKSTLDEMRHFYDSMIPYLKEIVDHLSSIDLDDFTEEEKLLGDLCFMLCEVDNPVNKWKSPILNDALDPRELHVKQDFYDREIVLNMGWESFSGGRYSDPELTE